MTTISIDTDNEKDLNKLKKIAAENGWQLSYSTKALHLVGSSKNHTLRLAQLMENVAAAGGLKSFGTDASAWQREQREEKPLLNR